MLGNDVLLDLVRAAVDRGFAVVEIPQGGPGLAAMADALLLGEVQAILLGHPGQGVIPGRFHEQGIERLLYLGAFDLENGGLRAGRFADGNGGQRAQLRELESLELYFESCELAREAGILEQRSPSMHRRAGLLAKTCEAVF